MEDSKIIELYFLRSERAIAETSEKYGAVVKKLALNILHDLQDAEECVNDTYLDAWNAMPTARPAYLGAFLSKITRRISIDRWRHLHREKRGGVQTVMEELGECIPAQESVEADYENGRLSRELNTFLRLLPTEKRVMFLRRYFYSQSTKEIAEALGVGEGKVKVTLHRLREQLRRRLEEQELL